MLLKYQIDICSSSRLIGPFRRVLKYKPHRKGLIPQFKICEENCPSLLFPQLVTQNEFPCEKSLGLFNQQCEMRYFNGNR